MDITTYGPYAAGKAAFLAGKPFEPPVGLSGVHFYDWRMGWRVAKVNRDCTPQWTDEFILKEQA